jgi:Flp pilus assembly protein TadG
MPLKRLRSTRHRNSGAVSSGASTGMRERGAEAVEFALVVPMFLLLVFGVVDFGYMINRDTLVNNASREGAREGSQNISSTSLNDIKCRVRKALASIEPPGLGADCLPSGTPPKVTLTITCRKPGNVNACTGSFPTDALAGGTVIVKIDYKHSWITPVGSTIMSGGITLSKITEMRIE